MKKVLLATIMLFSSSSFAEFNNDLIDGENIHGMLNVLKGFGYASLKSDENGDPEIEARIQGKPYRIIFYGCDAGDLCNEVVFSAKYPLTAKFNDTNFVNEWNRVNRYGTAYIDKEKNTLNLTMSINLIGGVSAENFDNSVDIWKNVVAEFQIFLSSKE